MNNLIALLSNSIIKNTDNYLSNNDLSIKYLISICINILFLIEMKNELNNISIYDIFIKYISKYNNIDIYILPSEILLLAIDIFNNLDLDLIKKELKINTFIEQLFNFVKKNKIYKNIIIKFLEPHITNYNIIKTSKQYYDLKDINSVMILFYGLGESYIPLLDINYKEICIYDKNKNINLLSVLNNKISYNINFENNIINSNIINDNIINKNVDLIICNISLDFKNIIYANCCNLIKKLKIRGTKAEPLILQLLMQLLNKNGTLLLYTPTSLLFNESNQHIKTRKYLIENFNIEKIINLENKKTLLIIKNNKEFKSIEVIKNNIKFRGTSGICTPKICSGAKYFTVDKANINKKTYVLNFIQIPEQINIGTIKKKLKDIIYIKAKNEVDELTYKVLYNYKFNNFIIDIINKDVDYNYVFLTKDENIINQEFLNIYLLNFFNKNIEKITKGKMNKIICDLIDDLEISILPLTTQKLILEQINLNNIIINNNDLQIQNFIEILNKFIDSIIYNNKKEELKDIFNIDTEINNKSSILIKKNSLSVGHVEKIINKEIYQNNTNYFYLNLIDISNNNNYYYYLLKYYQKEFINNAFKNKSIGLSKNYLELFNIPILNNEEKENLMVICKYIYQQIDLLQNNNNLLKDINIVNLII